MSHNFALVSDDYSLLPNDCQKCLDATKHTYYKYGYVGKEGNCARHPTSRTGPFITSVYQSVPPTQDYIPQSDDCKQCIYEVHQRYSKYHTIHKEGNCFRHKPLNSHAKSQSNKKVCPQCLAV